MSRIVPATLVCLTAALTLASCHATINRPVVTVTPSAGVPATSAPAGSASAAGDASMASSAASAGSPAPGSGDANGAPAVTVTVTQGIGGAPAPTGGAAMIDAAPFAVSGDPGFYAFVSPSGNLICGIRPQIAGCQARVLVANLPQCDAPTTTKAPLVTVTAMNGVLAACTKQGIFYAEKQNVLPYGKSIQAGGYTCTSEQSGVFCRHEASGKTLFASKERFGSVG